MKSAVSSASAQAAFVNWLNLFPLDSKVTSVDELSDGLVLAKILEDMDGSFTADELNQNASTWLEKKANLEIVFRNLDKYTCQDPDSDLDWLSRSYKPKEIAHSPDTEALCEALAVFVCVAMAGPNRQRYIGAIQAKLGPKYQSELAAVFRYKQNQLERLNAEEQQASKSRDRELELEEEAARLRADVDSMKNRYADVLTRLERLQLSNEDLREDNGKLRLEIEESRKHTSGNSEGIIAKLEDRLRESEEIISRQEQQIEEENLTKMRLNAELAHLRKQTESMTVLQDQVRELKQANQELSKKANAAERYKQKLESQHGIENELKNLQYELDEARKDQGGYQTLKAQVEAQSTSIGAYRRMQEETELHLNELRTQKNQFAELLAAKTQELDRLMAQRSLDERMIEDLREQITSNGVVRRSRTPSPAPASSNTRREGEDPAMVSMKLEISKLKAENAMLLNGRGVTATNDQLRSELEHSKRNVTELTQMLHELRVQHIASQKTLEGLMDNMTSEGTEAYKELYQAKMQAQQELEDEKRRSRKMHAQLQDANRELLQLRTDYKVATSDSIDALQELKRTHELISTSLQGDLESLRKDYERLDVEVTERRTQVMNNLLKSEQLREENEKLRDKASRMVDAAAQEEASASDGAANQQLVDAARKYEKLKVASMSLKEQLQKADQERYDLQRRLRTMEQGGAYAALKVRTTLMPFSARFMNDSESRDRPDYKELATRERNDINGMVRPYQPLAKQPRRSSTSSGHSEDLDRQIETNGQQRNPKKVGASRLVGLLELSAAALLRPRGYAPPQIPRFPAPRPPSRDRNPL
ncbi:hypothetical protein MAPG_10922 [Magnaporthiopsis poae ATCC 64411]|uniref:HOOK N-terminal domain-containing protein n=1 Tax=Magnaporthiopsis poae (strain ATCC 64411 / 73-15) TaxID=644358 RepID=A0A0C4EDW1_MAGP6|nr:hypothetical protein MAPG_10922 [Magnaporthiopsis poae ATCC 64411]